MGRTIPSRHISAFCLIGSLAGSPVLAQEPLLLRIRPSDGTPAEIGAGGTSSSANDVARARAAREAVWERADRRARIAIASVCTGCLQAEHPAQYSFEPRPDEPPARAEPASSDRTAAGNTIPAGAFTQHSSSQTGTP